MDKSIAFYLVQENYTQDSIGQNIPVCARRLVYGRTDSITRSEWSAAGEMGLQPALVVHMFAPDYSREQIVHIENADGSTTIYGVYRVYEGRNDDLELYLEWKVGNSSEGPGPVFRPLLDADGNPLTDSEGRLLVVEA